MGTFLIKIKDKYFEWSTIVDAPITYGMTLDEFKEYIKDEYGQKGLNELPTRLERAEKMSRTKSIVSFNRAGKNESYLTLDKIYEQYQFPESDQNNQI